MSSSPTIRALIEAVDQAAQAFAHSVRQAAAAESLQHATAGVFTAGVAAITDPASVLRIAEDSARSALQTFENCVTVWLAHAVADPTLRMRDENDIIRFTSLPAVAEAIELSPFSRVMFERLLDVTRVTSTI